MSWEYYVVNTNKKTLFYLGKHPSWTCLDGISSTNPRAVEYETGKDVILDMLKNNATNPEDTVEFLFTFAEALLDFCEGDEVFITFDSDEFIENYLNNGYTITMDITHIASAIYGD